MSYVFDGMKSLLLDISCNSNCTDVTPFHIHCSFLDTPCVIQTCKHLASQTRSACHLFLLDSICIHYFSFLHFCLHTDWSVLSTYGWHSIIRVHCDRYKADLQVLNLALMWKIFQETLVYFFLCWQSELLILELGKYVSSFTLWRNDECIMHLHYNLMKLFIIMYKLQKAVQRMY